MRITTLTVGAFQENCYLLVDDESAQAVLIDPGEDGARLANAARESGAALDAIWLTHAHLDHIGGIAGVTRSLGQAVPVFMHAADRPVYEFAPASAEMFGVPFESAPLPDRQFAEGDELALGSLRFTVMHTPGHAPGHVVLYGHGVAFVGDCLFAGSIGRTDIPLADGAALERSLARISRLPPETVVYPGHGPATTIADELATNPFLTGLARPLRR